MYAHYGCVLNSLYYCTTNVDVTDNSIFCMPCGRKKFYGTQLDQCGKYSIVVVELYYNCIILILCSDDKRIFFRDKYSSLWFMMEQFCLHVLKYLCERRKDSTIVPENHVFRGMFWGMWMEYVLCFIFTCL